MIEREGDRTLERMDSRGSRGGTKGEVVKTGVVLVLREKERAKSQPTTDCCIKKYGPHNP